MSDKEYQKYQSQGLRTKYLKSKLVSNNETKNFDSKNSAKYKINNISNSYLNSKEDHSFNKELNSTTKIEQDDNLTGFLLSNRINPSKDISFELSDEEIDLFSELSLQSENKNQKAKTEYIKPNNTNSSNQTNNLVSKENNNHVLTVNPKDISFENKKAPKKKVNYKVISYWIIATIAWVIIILILLSILYSKK